MIALDAAPIPAPIGITPFLFDLEEVGKFGLIGPPAPGTGL